MSDNEQDEIITEFLVEAHENLDVLDRELLALEKNPHTPELLASVFRRVHTVKGACGFLGFAKLETVAHASENLLSKVREEELELTPTIITALLGVADTMRSILRGIEADGKEGDEDYSSVVENINRLQTGGRRARAGARWPHPRDQPHRATASAPVARAPAPAAPRPAATRHAATPAPAPTATACRAGRRVAARRQACRRRPPRIRPPSPPAISARTTSPTQPSASTSACSTS